MRDSGGTLRTITQLRMRDSGGTLRTITRVRMRDASNVLRTVYDPAGTSTMSVTAPTPVHGTSAGSGTVTTNTTTAVASGGTSPYTYAWTLISHDHPSVSPTATIPAAATTAFQQTSVGVGEFYTSTWRVTATDSAVPANTATDDVVANFVDVS